MSEDRVKVKYICCIMKLVTSWPKTTWSLYPMTNLTCSDKIQMKIRRFKASIYTLARKKIQNKDWFPQDYLIIVLTDGCQFFVKKASMIGLSNFFPTYNLYMYIEVVVVRKKCFGYQINQSRHFY